MVVSWAIFQILMLCGGVNQILFYNKNPTALVAASLDAIFRNFC